MKLSIDFSDLRKAADKMGATERNLDLGRVFIDPIEEIRSKLKDGIEIDLKELETNRGDLLTYQEHHVLLYIMDHGWGVRRALENPGQGRRFHVADCQTLHKMRRQNRFERYVVATKTSGEFKITGQDEFNNEASGEARLHVCQHCLKLLNYQGFRHKSSEERHAFVESFNLKEFFGTYTSYFPHMPTYTDETAPASDYGPNWSDISYDYRNARNWICEQCGIDLKDDPGLLHVHHINGIKSNHDHENLKALCADCHSRQPQHGHMRIPRKQRLLINRLRNLNRQTLRTSWDEAIKEADPAVYGLLDLYRREDMAVPDVGTDIEYNGEIYAQVELAWIKGKLAVTLVEDEGTQLMRQRGWTVLSPGEAMAQWL